jgi:hypothetical protein
MNDAARPESYGVLIGWDDMIGIEKEFNILSGQLL